MTPAPAPLDSRYVSLDAVRGIAVMGILLLNIISFAMPTQAYFSPLAYGGDGPADIAVWATNFVLFDGKMRGLFSLLFGASMLLVIERAEAKEESPALTHYARMSWLLLFGAIHAYAIWYGDILMLYAVTGCIAFFMRKMEIYRLVTLGIILVIAEAAFMGLTAESVWQLRNAALAPGAEAGTIDQWRAMQSQFSVIRPDILADDLALHRGGYLDILAYRMGDGFWTPIWTGFYNITETLGLMLLGVAGLKSGFLTGEWDRASYARCIRIGYGIGIPLLALLALGLLASGFGPIAVFGLHLTIEPIVNLLVIMAHAALIIYWVKSAPGSALLARIAATGRAAFTNYLGTSLICTTLFYGYGFGLYGELSRAALYLVVPGVWIVMLLWSKPWLDRFHYGPLEWLWRTLARRKLQPLRK